MVVSVLTDNNPGSFTPAEHGLSYYIEFDNKKILFDTGQTNMYLSNAALMKVDVSYRDITILSHGHFDHGNGLDYLTGGKLLCHPGCFVRRFRKTDNSYIGLNDSLEHLKSKFTLTTSEKPYRISDHIIFLGEIPRITDFESNKTAFVFDDGSPDFVMDDSAVALLLDEGLFVITGCGHSGIVNTLEHAKNVTGETRIKGIMGGFHLRERDRQTTETVSYLKENNVSYVLPSHCTALPALVAFWDAFAIRTIRTGDILTF